MGENKLISFKKYCRGFETIFNENLSTSVKITYDLHTSTNGFIAGFKDLMPGWIKQLNEKCDGRVVSWKFDKQKRQLILEMIFAGALMKDKMNPKTANVIPNQFRKLLAMEVLETLPPPFDRDNPIFKAGIPDLIIMDAHLLAYERSEYDNLLLALENGVFAEKLSSYLEKFGANLIRIYPLRYAVCIYGIIINWGEDVSSKQRSHLINTCDLTTHFEPEMHNLLFKYKDR